MVTDLVNSADAKFAKVLEHLQEDLGSLRTGRASTALVDGLTIDVYGQPMQLKQIATIGTPDARTIAITPWDRTNLPIIEKAIRDTQSLGLVPSNDGINIRLSIPPLTEERRRDIVKSLKEKVEQGRIAARNIRHDILNEVKKLEKDKDATADDVKFAEQQLNKKMDDFQGQVEAIERAKEAELMQV